MHRAPRGPDATRHDVEWLRRWTAALVSRSSALAIQIDGSLSRSAMAQRRAWETRMRAQAMRDWSAALRAPVDETQARHEIDTPVQWFTLSGELAGHAVSASWFDGRLSECDPRLLTQARLLVEVGTVFVNEQPPAEVAATLTGPPAAVMLTLARACETVFSVDFEAAEEE